MRRKYNIPKLQGNVDFSVARHSPLAHAFDELGAANSAVDRITYGCRGIPDLGLIRGKIIETKAYV
jgi:hypothetical protein